MAGKSKAEGKGKKPYRLVKKKSGGYQVISKGKTVNGPEKTKILQAEGLVKTLKPKAKAE